MPRVPNTVWFQAAPQGGIWYLSGNRALTYAAAGLGIIEQWNFLSGSGLIIDDAIVPAMLVNAELLRVLYAQQQASRISRLWLSPPPSVKIPAGAIKLSVADEAAERAQVDSLLRRFEERRGPSQGGVRRVSQVDLDTFTLGSDAELAERHPGWPLLSFLPHFDRSAAAKLLSLLIDPRWYVDPLRPNSQHRLRDAFGLGAKGLPTMEAIITAQPVTPQRNGLWAKCVADTWYSTERRQQALHAGPSAPFPWSLYFKVAKTKPPAVALLKTNLVVLRTVCAVWLDNLTPPRQYTTIVDAVPGKWASAARDCVRLEPTGAYSPQLFVPAYCFSPSEVVEWRKHIAEWRIAFSSW